MYKRLEQGLEPAGEWETVDPNSGGITMAWKPAIGVHDGVVHATMPRYAYTCYIQRFIGDYISLMMMTTDLASVVRFAPARAKSRYHEK